MLEIIYMSMYITEKLYRRFFNNRMYSLFGVYKELILKLLWTSSSRAVNLLL
jgi:hypothetical protein